MKTVPLSVLLAAADALDVAYEAMNATTHNKEWRMVMNARSDLRACINIMLLDMPVEVNGVDRHIAQGATA